MSLKTKLFILLGILCVTMVFYILFVMDYFISYPDTPLTEKPGHNLLENIRDYTYEINNTLATRDLISTGMYTDADYKNLKLVLKIPSNDPILMDAWSDNSASIYYESYLQRTTEWICNNYYILHMYYYLDDNTSSNPITILSKRWAGLDRRVSGVIAIPEEAQGKSIYIEYASELGSILTLKNGNDIRFYHNYLSIK